MRRPLSQRVLELAVLAVATACAPPAPFEMPDDGFVEVRGARMAYRVLGDGPGTPVIFIHGGPGISGCNFDFTLGALLETRPVVLYDQVGTGYSSRIPPERMDEFTEFGRFIDEIEALRAELRLDAVHLFGTSWGSAVALEYLLEGNAEGVESVVFGGPFFGTQRWIDDTDRLVASLSESSRAAIADAVASGEFDTEGFAEANEEFMGNFVIRTPADELDWADCLYEPGGDSGQYETMWGPSEFVSTGTLRDYDRVGRLSEVRIPTLFLLGEYDEPSPETVRDYQSRIAGARMEIIPDAGHVIDVDQPELFNDALVRFFADVEGR